MISFAFFSLDSVEGRVIHCSLINYPGVIVCRIGHRERHLEGTGDGSLLFL